MSPAETLQEEEASTNTLKLSQSEFLEILEESMFNWFEVINRVMERNNEVDEESMVTKLESFFSVAMDADFIDKDKALLEQSYQAFKCDCNRRHLVDREADALNGLIVTDSESEDPDQYIDLHDITRERAKSLIAMKRKSLHRKASYLK